MMSRNPALLENLQVSFNTEGLLEHMVLGRRNFNSRVKF